MKSKFKIKNILNRIQRLMFILSIVMFFVIIYDLGFTQNDYIQEKIGWFYLFILGLETCKIILTEYLEKLYFKKKIIYFEVFGVLFFIVLFLSKIDYLTQYAFFRFFSHKLLIYVGLGLMLLREFSNLKIEFNRKVLNPAQLLISSFLIIIFIGALLLKLPNSTSKHISFLDALFTSTSAVCVTGLTTLDISATFTDFGVIILLVLIQVGGLGIMTFASYFSYFFKGQSSYESRLILRDLTNVSRLSDVFNMLKTIMIITFSIELLGAVFIYSSIDTLSLSSVYRKIFFSVFHSISAFCNAGFSTMPDGIHNEILRYNYPLLLSLSGLIILGSLGFPIVYNIYKFIKHWIIDILLPFSRNKKRTYTPWMLNLSARIILITTIILLVAGTVFIYLFEYNNTLGEHRGLGKLVVAFFQATVPRTAGFDAVAPFQMHFHTILIVIFLMWVGASPASTGGGIKTSTFAIAFINILSIAKNKDRVEIFRREISHITIRRAFAIIMLSVVSVGTGILLISYFDGEKTLLSIAYECFSAFGTVGSTLGVTPLLSIPSKVVVIILMFVGRISMLSIFIAFLKDAPYKNYRYPSEEILIN